MFLLRDKVFQREYDCHLRYADIIPYGYLTYLLGGCSYKNTTEVTMHAHLIVKTTVTIDPQRRSYSVQGDYTIHHHV